MTADKYDNKANRKRIYFLFILFIIAFSLISYRLVSVQYLNASKYRAYAKYQHLDEFKLYSKRGKILDRNGNELAVSIIEKTIYANPKEIEDPGEVSKLLSDALSLDIEDLYKKLSDSELGFIYIKRKVISEEASKIVELGIKGIYIQDESKRYYPQEYLAGSIIGFTGTDGNGLYGVELEYENILRGVDGRAEAEIDVFGNIIPGNIKTYLEPVDGKDIVLTIDTQIQFIAEKNLEAIVSQYDALGATVVVMDPRDGEVLAMASYPGFDPNNYVDYDEQLYRPWGVSYTYEPGSTFKIINVATALENGTVEKDQIFDLPPSIKVADRTIKEIFRTGNINYSTREIIQYSSNVGAVVVALSMGNKMFWEGMKEFGFGEKTGIGLPGEEDGILHDYNSWPASTIGALAIGQSISVTPLQLLRAICVIANGGYLIDPVIIKDFRIGDEIEEVPNNLEEKRILALETANSVKDMMLAVVQDGTGKNAAIKNIDVCGKTGTAEKANKNGIGYSEGRSITSFVGFAPYIDPQLAVIVMVDEPQGAERTVWGGTVAAPVFKEVMEYSLDRIKGIK